jgi:4-nitrophenyl phosphatase
VNVALLDAGREALLASVKGVIFDLDGVLYQGDEALPGAGELVSYLRSRGLPTLALTNHSARSNREVADRLAAMGIGLSQEEIITSAWATARYLRETGVRRVFVIGSDSLRRELRRAGLQEDDSEPEAVIVGYSSTVAYGDLARATAFLLGGARLVGTNPDALLPLPAGPVPECGPTLAYLEAATKAAAFVVGKPNRWIVELALERSGLPAGETVLVGDTADTDVEAGRSAGTRTALVLTGNGTLEDAARADIAFASLVELLACFKRAHAETSRDD